MLWRRVAAIVICVVAFGAAFPAPAAAHAYTGSYTWRLHGCAGSNQACQAHYILAVDDPYYGPLWRVQHTHGCTSPNNIYSKWVYMNFRISAGTGSTAWYVPSHDWTHHEHTSQWCGQSAGSHEFYPNTFVVRGSNTFAIQTSSYDPVSKSWYTLNNVLYNV